MPLSKPGSLPSFGGDASIGCHKLPAHTSSFTAQPKSTQLLQSPWNVRDGDKKSTQSNLGLVSALKGYLYLGVAVLMTTFKFPEAHVPHRKGKFICSCQWSVSLSSRYGLAARTAVPFTPSRIKLSWEGQERANPSGRKGAWEVTCPNLCSKQLQEQDGVCNISRGGKPTTCRQSEIVLTWENHLKWCTSTYQKHLHLQTVSVQHREKLLGYAHIQEEENQRQTRLLGQKRSSQPRKLLWGNS